MCTVYQKSFPKRWHRIHFACKWQSGHTERNFIFHLLGEEVFNEIDVKFTNCVLSVLSVGKSETVGIFRRYDSSPTILVLKILTHPVIWYNISKELGILNTFVVHTLPKSCSDVYKYIQKQVYTKEQKALLTDMNLLFMSRNFTPYF